MWTASQTQANCSNFHTIFATIQKSIKIILVWHETSHHGTCACKVKLQACMQGQWNTCMPCPWLTVYGIGCNNCTHIQADFNSYSIQTHMCARIHRLSLHVQTQLLHYMHTKADFNCYNMHAHKLTSTITACVDTIWQRLSQHGRTQAGIDFHSMLAHRLTKDFHRMRKHKLPSTVTPMCTDKLTTTITACA